MQPDHQEQAVVVEVDVAVADADEVSTAAWALGAWSVEERPPVGDRRVLAVGFPEQLQARVGAAALGGRVVPIADGWQDGWRAHAQVRRAGRIVLRPVWLPLPAVGPDDLVIEVEPGRAFGDGGHPTTRTALAALEATVRTGDRVLDVGCGSGVLSVAAVLLGASHAHGVDLDAHAVRITAEMAERNGVADRVTVGHGELAAVSRPFDVTVANLGGTQILVDLAADLDRATTRTIVLGGLLDGREGPALDALPGWVEHERWIDGSWTTLALYRSG